MRGHGGRAGDVSLHFNPKTIVGQFYTFGQFGADRGVVDVVAHVCEVGPGWFQCRDLGEGLFKAEVGGMRSTAQGVYHQDVEVGQERPACIRDGAYVRQVRQPALPPPEPVWLKHC